MHQLNMDIKSIPLHPFLTLKSIIYLKNVSSCFFYANAFFLDSGKTRWSETGLVSGRHDWELVAAKL